MLIACNSCESCCTQSQSWRQLLKPVKTVDRSANCHNWIFPPAEGFHVVFMTKTTFGNHQRQIYFLSCWLYVLIFAKKTSWLANAFHPAQNWNQGQLFIRQRSDHSLRMSITYWQTDDLVENRLNLITTQTKQTKQNMQIMQTLQTMQNMHTMHT